MPIWYLQFEEKEKENINRSAQKLISINWIVVYNNRDKIILIDF